MGKPTAVCLEIGKKRVFACALDWPGWSRSGRDEERALAALADYAPRFAPVAKRAGLVFPAGVADDFRVVERLPGDATTEFGAPGQVASADSEPSDKAAGDRMAALLAAAWKTFDLVAAKSPAELRKGPRGGGRDRDKMIDHVIGAEASYARKIGVRHRQPAIDDDKAIAAMREDILAVLREPSDGEPPVPKGWPIRYATRRFAWHVLDHAWEMQDRAT
jgi:hypothetical protein